MYDSDQNQVIRMIVVRWPQPATKHSPATRSLFPSRMTERTGRAKVRKTCRPRYSLISEG